MDEVTKRAIAELLKNIGFEAVDRRAMELLFSIFDDRLTSYLGSNSRLSLLCSRPTTTLVDLFGIRQNIPRIGNELHFPPEVLTECNVSLPPCTNRTIQNLFSLVHIKKLHFPIEMIEPEPEWTSPLSTRVEKFIHVYEFMPNFPPIHTFRISSVKNTAMKNQSSKVKNRLDQSLKSEGSMVKLIKSSGSMPKFINYLYK